MPDKNEGTYRGRRDDTCDHGLSRISLMVKTCYELSWKVKVYVRRYQGNHEINYHEKKNDRVRSIIFAIESYES